MNPENNRLKDILTLNELSCYALQAVVVWDDVTDRLEELPERLRSLLSVSGAEVEQATAVLRKVLDQAKDAETDLATCLTLPDKDDKPNSQGQAMSCDAEEGK